MGFKFGFIGGFCLAVGEGFPLPLYEKKQYAIFNFYRFREGRPLPYNG